MNAIILAAGLGSRFGGMTLNDHKALLPVGGIPNIERTVLFLNQAGVTDVTIITGHMSHLFSYLADKYGTQIIYNSHYIDYNNIYSMYLGLDKFGDTLVIDADVVLLANIFVSSEYSLYYLIERSAKGAEWIPRVDGEGFVCEMLISDQKLPSMLGISYWNKKDSKVIREAFKEYMTEDVLTNPKLYWDNIPITLFDKLRVKTLLVSKDSAGEMDTQEEYQSILKLVAARPPF